MTVTGSENYTTVYSYNDSQGKYKALLMSESKTSADEKPLPGFTTTAEKTTYTYDKNGSQLTKTTSEKTETNTYNAVSQLVGFTDGETTASYAYNASGLRYEKTVDGETVHHVWDGNQQIIADVVESQFYEANCYIRGTNLAATYHYQNGAKSDYTYYVQNAHGDVVNLTDADGAVTKTYHYDAFGVELDPTTGDVNVFRYCGEYFDTETGTVYLRARYYQAAIGRFTQRDSYAGKNGKPLSLNLYTYCANNPIFYIDPSGHSYGTLPDGTRFSINSQHDAEKFNELRDKQLSENRSVVAYVEDKILRPITDDVKTFGRAVWTSWDFSFATGGGFGGKVEVMGVEGVAMIVPMRTEYVISHDPQVNHTSKFAFGVDAFEEFSIGLEHNYSRPFNQEQEYVTNFWDGNDGKWETKVGINYGPTTTGYNSHQGLEDVKIGTGAGLYCIVGMEFEVSFNISNFFRITSGLEVQDE